MTTDAAGKAIFVFTADVENATGGLGNDTLVGDDNDNVLSGMQGSNLYDGAGGVDTAVIDGVFAAFTFDCEFESVSYFEIELRWKVAGSDGRALCVEKDTDGALHRGAERAYSRDYLSHPIVGCVAHVEAEYIRASFDQGAEDLF